MTSIPTQKSRSIVISREDLGSHINLTAEGTIDSETSSQFEDQLRSVLRDGYSDVLLSLAGVDFITSAGLRVLLIIAKELYDLDGTFVLYSCQPNVKAIFTMTGFDTILNVSGSYSKALMAVGNSKIVALKSGASASAVAS